MRRRQFGYTIGGGIVALGLSPLASARQEGELPNGRVENTVVAGFTDTKEEAHTVPTGNWITHRVGWYLPVDAYGKSTKSGIKKFLDTVEFSAWIDGEKINNAMQYWGDPVEIDDEWYTYWRYSTPPKKPGYHTFKTVWEFPEGYEYGDLQPRDPGDRDEHDIYYEVEQNSGNR